MDRRREPRFDCRQKVRLVNLGTDEEMEATLANVSGRGMQLRTARRIALSTPVRVDYGEILLLGDVCYCQTEASGFLCGIKLAHTLSGGAALSNLMRQVGQDSSCGGLQPSPVQTRVT